MVRAVAWSPPSRDRGIAAFGDAASIQVPSGAKVLDLTGRSVIPGFADQRPVELLVGSGFTPLEAMVKGMVGL